MPLVISEARPPGSGFLQVGLCCLTMIFEGFMLQAPGLTAPAISILFGLSATQRGFYLSVGTIGLMLGAMIGGRMSDWIGRKWTLVISVTLFGVLSLLTAVAPTTTLLLWARFLTGVGLGGALPNLIALAPESVAPSNRNIAVGFLLSAPALGGVAVSLVSTYFHATRQWPIVYYVGGIASLLVVAPMLALGLRSHRKNLAASSRRVPLLIGQALFGGGRRARTLTLWLGFLCVMLALYTLLSWLPSLSIARGLSPAHASLTQMFVNLCSIPGSLMSGMLLDRARRRGTAVMIVYSAAVIGIGLLVVGPGVFLFWFIAAGFAGGATTGAQTVMYSLLPMGYPAAGRGTGVGFCIAVARIGAAGGPMLAGVMVGLGYSPGQVLLMVMPVVVVAGLAALSIARSLELAPAIEN
jgi:AAHS family 3-hydroxyphenylpropionic acid transporter